MATSDYIWVGIILSLLSALLWTCWLYVETYRRLVVSDRDRDRLIRRIGLYHSLPLITPYEQLPELPKEVTLPPAFRMRRPTPPPGYKESK